MAEYGIKYGRSTVGNWVKDIPPQPSEEKLEEVVTGAVTQGEILSIQPEV